jgi:hypothetical protein
LTKQETIKIIAILKVAYPRYFVSTDEIEIRAQIDTWYALFQDEPFPLVEQAVKALICTLKFPPTVADVKEKIYFITQPKAMSEMEAWDIVYKAIPSFYDNAREKFNTLPPVIQRAIGSASQLRRLGQIESDTAYGVAQSNFMRSYREELQAEKEYKSLPSSTKQMIENSHMKELKGETT